MENTMFIYVLCLAALCATNVFAADPVAVKGTPRRPAHDAKLKREATNSNGNGYHGPIYKYLPPSVSHTSSAYENYRDVPQNNYANVGTYSFANAGANAGHNNEHEGGSAPRVETYIVQTETTVKEHAGPMSGPGVGYKYSGSPNLLKKGHNIFKSGFSGGHSAGREPLQKHKTILIPVRNFASGSHGDSGFTRFNGHNGNGDSFSYPKVGSSPFFFSSANTGKNYVTKFVGFNSNENGAHSAAFDASGSHGPQSFNHGNTGSSHTPEQTYHRGADYSGTQAGHAEESPAAIYRHGSPEPSSNYGAPIRDQIPAYKQGHGNLQQQQPAYAAGQKGLGHFSYESSRPHSLSNKIANTGSYQDSYGNTFSHGDTSIVSQVPFKPSVFLGLNSDNGISGLPAQHTAYAPEQYLPPPPTSAGYEYASQAGHGIANQFYIGPESKETSEEHALAYLSHGQPQASYESPVTSGEKYLPPN